MYLTVEDVPMIKSDTSLKNLYEKFIQFEEENHLFSKKIADVFFWERIRFTVFISILQNKIDASDGEKKVKKEKNFNLSNYLL